MSTSGKVHRLAVIGLGDMGSAHASCFNRLENCHVVATVDLDPRGVLQHGVEWRRQAPTHYIDYREMLLREKPEAVVVAVPDLLHREVSEAALAAGCHLFLEKPVATTLEDADAIAAMAAKLDRVLQIGLVYRYSSFYRRMAERAAEPGHEVSLMWCKELRQPFPQRPWFYSQTATGGTIVEKDCHHFDIFNWVIRSKAVRVFATGGQHRWKSGSEIACNYCPDPPRVIESIDTVDHALVTVDYENGARACLILCMYLTPQNVMPEGLEIGAISRSGRQICAYADQRMGIGGIGEPFTWETIDMVSDNEGLGHIGCQEQRRDFLRCIEEGRRPIADSAVGRDSLAIALAAERSIREERPIDLRS